MPQSRQHLVIADLRLLRTASSCEISVKFRTIEMFPAPGHNLARMQQAGSPGFPAMPAGTSRFHRMLIICP